MKLLLFIFIAAVGGVIYYHYANLQSPAQIVLGLDPSVSVRQNCAAIEQTAKAFLTQPGVGEGSSLTFLAMGRAAHDPEPRRVFEERIPFPSGEVFGNDPAAFEKKKEAFVKSVRTACDAISSTPDSPILRLVQRGIEHLRQSCSPAGTCYMTVKTDLLEESGDALLTAVIARAAKDSSVTLPPELSGSIDNAWHSSNLLRRLGNHVSPARFSPRFTRNAGAYLERPVYPSR